jgi:(2Fe-2S) ferredoxin
MHGVESLQKQPLTMFNTVPFIVMLCRSDTVSATGPIQYPVRCQDVRVLCVYRKRKTGAMAYFKISPQNVPKITKQNHNNTSEYAEALPRV